MNEEIYTKLKNPVFDSDLSAFVNEYSNHTEDACELEHMK